MGSPQILTTIAQWRAIRRTLSPPIALVPTMGALHQGHLSLVERALALTPNVIVSIFVNPLQFGANEDYDRYPRQLEQDCTLLAQAGVPYLFAPSESEIYPEPQRILIDPPPELAATLEGAARPGHFRGVATVVLKLFHIIAPTHALFGKKDYQQLLLIRTLVRQLALDIEIVAGDTVRAEDGLALSSRNCYLTPAQRAEAPRLYRTLSALAERIRAGRRDYPQLERDAYDHLLAHGWQPDYIAIRTAATLGPPPAGDPLPPLVLLGAARLGTTRLIDAVEL
ncbi:MAG: pantoate--beta-alanine ligase [Hydrogenophilus sp.]|nr:pantoate--beta-alanine ligase [Hydrogenophilus sp.]